MRIFTKNSEKIVKIKLADITILPELASVFQLDEKVKERIKEDMSNNGFSKSHPVHIFRWNSKWVLCDGHTRFTAAKELELSHIWAQVHTFNSLDEARLYSMQEQFNRRNILDKDLFIQFEVLQNEIAAGKKMSAKEISERLNKSKRHIFKIQEVYNKASKLQLDLIKKGKASINKIYNEIKQHEADKLIQAETENSEINQTIEIEKFNNSIIPHSESDVIANANEKESKELQKKHRVIATKEIELRNKELKLKQAEMEFSSRLTDKEIILLGMKLALIEVAKGKTFSEILSINFDETLNASNLSISEADLKLLKS